MATLDIAFDIGGVRFRSGLVDENGHVSNAVAFESPTNPDDVVEHIQRIVESYSVTATDPIIGIAIGGMVEKSGKVTAGSMNMMEYPLEERLGLKRPVVIINDAKASALAEAKFNPRLRDKSTFMVMTISAGIGSGIIIDGDLYEGHFGTAGEVGHMIIDRAQNIYCRLGHRGCLDAVASGRALNNWVRKLWREGHWSNYSNGVDIHILPELLAVNDGMAHRVIGEAGRWIGEGIMHIIRVLDPCEIVFKGYLITELWDYITPHIRGVLDSYDQKVPLSLSSLGENVGLVGAGIAAQRLRAKLLTV